MQLRPRAAFLIASSALLCASGFLGGAPAASADGGGQGGGQHGQYGQYDVDVIAHGTASMNQPDDITYMHGHLFVGYQNGVGSMGEPSPTGGTQSTIAEYTPEGRLVATWDVTGKCDGLSVDPAGDRVIGTLNEDGNSNLFTIDPDAPAGGQVTHYSFSPSTLPHGGGTDAISVYEGQILISASAPNPTPADVPAVYQADLAGGVATLHPFFSDEASATVANVGPQQSQTVKLALTDPDSNEVVPGSADRFQGDFVLDSQGDEEQVYVHGTSTNQSLRVLNLTQSIDDTAWVTDPGGTLYMSDHADNELVAVSGRFQPGTAFVAVTPADANNAPPNAGPSYLGVLDMRTGTIDAVPGISAQPQGMVFVKEH